MESTIQQPFEGSWAAEPLLMGAGLGIDRQEWREGARLVEGFEIALLSEVEGLPPVAAFAAGSNGIAEEV